MTNDAPVIEVHDLVKHFRASGGRTVHAVNGVSFELRPGETLGLVGESGSGKSTIGRTVLRLTDPTSGRIAFCGRDITTLGERELRPLRAEMQIVFQDPWGSLNPRLRIERLIEEPLMLHSARSRAERRDEVEALAESVHLNAALLQRYPGELSGGQLQRVCIARAIATRPKLIVLDEPTSSLDLSVRAGILELLHELKRATGAAMLFISHDLDTVRLISDRILVLYLGYAVERAATPELFARPTHPYTRALLSAQLPPDPAARLDRQILRGETPSPVDLPMGCVFASRCPHAVERCTAARPHAVVVGAEDHTAACVRAFELVPDA